MARHDEPAPSGVGRVQGAAVHKLWHVVLGGALADGLGVDDDVADEQVPGGVFIL